MWERFVCEFFDDGVLFAIETPGSNEKQRYGKASSNVTN